MFTCNQDNLEIMPVKPSKPRARNRREELINEFVNRINTERVGTKYKPISSRAVAILVNQHPNLKSTQELSQFLGRCKEAKSFGATFFWVTKPKVWYNLNKAKHPRRGVCQKTKWLGPGLLRDWGFVHLSTWQDFRACYTGVANSFLLDKSIVWREGVKTLKALAERPFAPSKVCFFLLGVRETDN